MQSPALPADLNGTRTDRIAEEIRLDIARNVLRGGMRLTEESLAERFGISRTPVREALRMLAREHLLIHTPRAGYTVAEVNLDEMDDLYAVRVAIEEQVAARVAARGANATAELTGLLAYWDGARQDSDINLVFADEHFHESLAQASGSKVLAPLLRNINQRVHCLRIRDFVDPERVRLTFEQHTAILRSLLDHDARLAKALLRAHIWQSYAFVRGSLGAAQKGES